MVLALASEGRAAPARSGGLARFIAEARLAEECADLRSRRFLVAGASAVPLARGRLREVIDEAVEGALAMRGALPPCVAADAELEPSIRDQVFRTRALGLSGLVVALPRLRSATGERGDLDPSDGEALRAWMEAAREAPVVLLLEEGDRGVRLLAPVTLSQLVPEAPVLAPAPVPAPAQAPAQAPAPVIVAEEARARLVEEVRSRPMEEARARHVEEAHALPTQSRSPVEEAIAKAAAAVSEPMSILTSKSEKTAPPQTQQPQQTQQPPARPPRERSAAASNEHILSAAERRTFAMELDAARGPKPARVIDQLFTTRYVPLLGSVARGEADAAVRSVVDAWRTSFEHSYRESFASMRVTGKRPSMVFDAPEIAAKIGRLNGARAVRLLLVDAMSYELGERIMGRLKDHIADKAVCVERALLWAALPSTTSQQMALLARGADALREASPEADPEGEIARGRAITTLRRERIGAREVMKLDCVEARLRNAGPPYEDRMEGIAEEAAPVVAKFMESLQPRTLLFVFGDHGFRLVQSPDGSSTGSATQGGASPEEVLVPGYAWLVGGVH
jgi:hypothetical protein